MIFFGLWLKKKKKTGLTIQSQDPIFIMDCQSQPNPLNRIGIRIEQSSYTLVVKCVNVNTFHREISIYTGVTVSVQGWGSQYWHYWVLISTQGLDIRTRKGSRYRYCTDKICTLSDSRRGVSVTVLVRIPRPQCSIIFCHLSCSHNNYFHVESCCWSCTCLNSSVFTFNRFSVNVIAFI